jgi:uncharacterized caspase-like protein
VVHITDPADLTTVDGGDVIVSFEAEAADPVRNVMALVNGRLALRQPRQETAGGRVTGRVLVPVPAGEDTVSLIAENAQGASDPATVRISVRGGQPTPVKKPTLHVIAVGVSNYQNGDLHLDFAAKDATDLANRFEAEKGGLYGDVKVWPLWDKEAGRNAILRTFVEAKRAVHPGDVVVVFLSGHGADERGSYFYLPYDVEADGPETITYSGISQLELREALRGFFEAGTKVIALFDTCYSGDAVGTRALPPDIDVVAQELAAAENGIVVITSSTGTELSRESKELQHGIFTSALLEALGGKADANRDGYISLSELRGYLGTRVQALSGNRQHPTVRG